jgi:hypothetical protein
VIIFILKEFLKSNRTQLTLTCTKSWPNFSAVANVSLSTDPEHDCETCLRNYDDDENPPATLYFTPAYLISSLKKFKI